MASEFKLSYTAADINEKLGKIDILEAELDNLSGGNVEIQNSGGNSIYYMDSEVEYPVGNGFYSYSVAKYTLSNSGTGIKVGDIIVASNGTLCKVTSVGTMVDYDPFGTISDTGDDSGGNVDLTGYAQKSELPTKVSELTNDRNFATEDYVDDMLYSSLDGLRLARITQEQYDALSKKDPNTIYIIVSGDSVGGDNTGDGSTNIYNLSWKSGTNLSSTGQEVSNADQAAYRTTDFIRINPEYGYKVATSSSSQFTVYYYDRNKNYIGNNEVVNDKTELTLFGLEHAPEDTKYIRIRTNNSSSTVAVEEMGLKDESNVPFMARNKISVDSKGNIVNTSADSYLTVNYVEIENYHDYEFKFDGDKSRVVFYDSDKKFLSVKPNSSEYYNSTTTLTSDDMPERAKYMRMRFANTGAVNCTNVNEHLTITKTPVKSENILTVTWIDATNLSNTGVAQSDVSAICSDFVTITDGHDYMYTLIDGEPVGFRVYYYNSNKEFISRSDIANNKIGNQKMQLPYGAAYFRVKVDTADNSININNINDIVVIKRLTSEENLLYSFGLISDVHVDNGTDGDFTDPTMSMKDYKNALRFLEDEGANFIAYCGDMAKGDPGKSQDYGMALECLESSNIPNYIISGNHDCGSYFRTMMNPDKYYTVQQNNDIFIFVNVRDRGITGGVDRETIDAVREIINNNPNKRLFLMYHYFIRNHGSGDGTGGYYGGDTLGDNYTDYPLSKEWADLIIGTPNLIFCHGHSHMRFSAQDTLPNNNLYHADGECYSVHVPSCCVPRTPKSSSVGLTNFEEGSEGYLVKVFTDRVEFKAIDFTTNSYLTDYNQIVDLPESVN